MPTNSRKNELHIFQKNLLYLPTLMYTLYQRTKPHDLFKLLNTFTFQTILITKFH